MRTSVALGVFSLGLTLAGATARAEQQSIVWAPRPAKVPEYVAPQKPHVKLADVRARHERAVEWREVVINDGYARGMYIQAPAGDKGRRHFHPDTRVWSVVMDGQILVEIENQQPFVAARGSLIQVPKQTLYRLETIGDKPSLRFEVTLANLKTLYTQEAPPPPSNIDNYVMASYTRRPAPYENGNQPHINLYEAAEAAGEKYSGGRAITDERLNASLIYGFEKNLPALDPNDRGHFHPESPEFWVVMAGQIRYAIEDVPVFVAEEGDIAYVPAGRYHLARFAGSGPSCRLAITRFLNNSALIER